MKDAGMINTYWVDNYNFGKIAYDYAVYLLSMQDENINTDDCIETSDEDIKHLFGLEDK